MLRDIIEIDTEKCTGCGLCLVDCAEQALAIVDGKATLVKDTHCDGLGACLGACPEGALHIIQREAEPFDESLVPQTCPGTVVHSPDFASSAPQKSQSAGGLFDKRGSSGGLQQWPIQLRLIPADALFVRGRPLVIAADCAGFASANIQALFTGRALVICCPKLDDASVNLQKLTDLFRNSKPSSVTVVRMSVPCCGGLERLVSAALQEAGLSVQVEATIIPVP